MGTFDVIADGIIQDLILFLYFSHRQMRRNNQAQGNSGQATPFQFYNLPFPLPKIQRSQTFSFNMMDLEMMSKLQKMDNESPSPKTPMRKLKILYKQSIKNIQQQKNEQLKKKQKDKQQTKRNDSIPFKMKLKLEQQLKLIHLKIEEKEKFLDDQTKKIQKLNCELSKTKQEAEDICNNEQMLLFKEKQLNNLTTIHNELLQSAKRQLMAERQIKVRNEQKIYGLKKQITGLKGRLMQKKEMSRLIDRLKEDKRKIESQILKYELQQSKKIQVLSESIRALVYKIILKRKRSIEEQIQSKVKKIAQISNTVQNHKELKNVLSRQGITPSTYYTYNQLKYVPELNFKTHKESQHILLIFNTEIHPQIPQVIHQFDEPDELIRLKQQIQTIQEEIEQKKAQIKKRQAQIDVLEPETTKLVETLKQYKRKHEKDVKDVKNQSRNPK